MSRLIDADALLETIGNTWEYTNPMTIIDLINNAPTVQREGWVSVPIEPTEEMIDAGRTQGRNNELEFRHRDEGAKLIYKAMISATPKE
jgi:hypothetical protein